MKAAFDAMKEEWARMEAEALAASGPPPGSLGSIHPESGRLILSPKSTLPTAEAYVRQFHQHPESRTLHAYHSMLMEWRGNRYVELEDAAVRHLLQPWLHGALRYHVVDRKARTTELVAFDSNPATVSQALESIRQYVHLNGAIESPAWLDGRTDPPPRELIPCLSLNLHVASGLVIPATPALFTVNALDFDYVPDAPQPKRWLKFLRQLFGTDKQSIRLLSEWFGYCLTGDTSLQKMLLMVGPRRSGKGTLGRVLGRLAGIGNVVNPTTSSLAGTFGLQPLVGKSLAIVSDARFVGDTTPIVVERLLNISGEDPLTVERKFMTAVTMKLPTRFMFMTNELPRFSDASTALAGRFLVLQLTRSFYGKEDSTLTEQLLEELPGILLWAIEGWGQLQKRGRFLQPASAADAIRNLEDLASPVGAFLRECCEVKKGLRVDVEALYRAWKQCCEREGRTAVGTKQSFGRALSAAAPRVKRRRGTENEPFYEGIALR